MNASSLTLLIIVQRLTVDVWPFSGHRILNQVPTQDYTHNTQDDFSRY